jgi:hypothetical protein
MISRLLPEAAPVNAGEAFRRVYPAAATLIRSQGVP